jgi:anti-sigma28 factor (negative regulator of flagellin synthesis)
MMHAQHIKYGILSGLLLLATTTLSVTADSQRSVFAQITPAPEKFSSNDHTTDSSHEVGTGNDNPQGITPSEKTDDATEEESTDSTDSNGINSGQTTNDRDDEVTTNEEQDFDPTNQLVEAIKNEVNEALSASGITIP